MDELLERHSEIFYLPGEKLKGTNVLQHEIRLTDDVPVHIRQYRYPPVHREEIKRQVKELLDGGIIRPSRSPYNSPLWIVPKKPDAEGNKRWRLVVDFRALNAKTVGDS